MRELRRIGRTRAVAIGLAAVLLGFASVLALRSGGGHDRARQAGRPVDLSTRATSSPRTDTTTSAPTSRRPALSLPRLIGQRIMVGFPGVTPTKSLLDRVRAGTVGGVILFGQNIRSVAQTRSVTRDLQSAARAGGNPPLLISVDQEGGIVRRFPGGAPDLSPPQMARSGNPAVAYDQGVKTGRLLAMAGVNLDLAPVVDVPTSPRSFIAQQGRSFGTDAATVTTFADEFVRGLHASGVLATAKHFPGVGSAAVDTDNKLQRIVASSRQLSDALQPYRRLAQHKVDLVMLATGVFPAYDPRNPAALSPRVQHLLRHTVGFRGVTITDALESPTGKATPAAAGVAAAASGADIVLFTSARDEYPALLGAARGGGLSRANLEASYNRILALKQAVRP